VNPYTTQTINYALRYAKLNWRVIHSHWPIIGKDGTPLCSCGREHDQAKGVGKHPIPRDWVNNATTNPDVIRAWFTVKPDANLSIVTGKASGIFVLDIDGPTGSTSLAILIAKYGPLPATPMFVTGSGGFHYVFEHPGWSIPTKAQLADGIDLRGDGGQIIAPPSRNVNGYYDLAAEFGPLGFEDIEGITRCVPVVAAPDWLLAMISASSTIDSDPNRVRSRFNIQEALNGTAQGGRDTMIFKLAAKMRDEDIPMDMALDWIRRAAENCSPPFPLKLAEEKVRWAYEKYTPRVQWDRTALNRREPPRQTIGPEWVQPFPISTPTGKPLPENVFPTWLERYINAVAKEVQVPAGMVATIALSTIAACVSKKGIVRILPSWKEPLNLYTIVACPPSSRKTPTFKAVMEPLYEHQERLIEQAQDIIAEKQARKELLRMRLERLKKAFAKGDENTMPPEIVNLQLELSRLEIIDVPRILGEDITPEKLTTLLFRNHERIAILSSEGAGVFLQMCGKYTGLSDPEMYIKGYSGDAKIVDRVGRPSEYLKCPSITLGLAVQPKVMRGVAQIKAADQGLFARPLYCFPEDNIGTRKLNENPLEFDPSAIDFSVRQTYLDRLHKLLELRIPEPYEGVDGHRYDGVNVLTFDDDALQVFIRFYNEVEEEMGLQYDDTTREWLGKLCGNIARVVSVLHLADKIEDCKSTEDVWKFPIMPRTVEAGVKLGEWFMTHATAAFEEMQSDPIKNYAIVLVKWIRKNQLTRFFKSDAIQQLGGAAGDKTVSALTFLAERGYIRTCESNTSWRDNLQFETNPAVLTGDFRSIDAEDITPNDL
jgi:replicative DNA helicase